MIEFIKSKLNNWIDDRIKTVAKTFTEKNTNKSVYSECFDSCFEPEGLSAEQKNNLIKCSIQRSTKDFVLMGKDGKSISMDAAGMKNIQLQGLTGVESDKIYTFYARHGFIGWQMCAIIAQNWAVNNACSIPAENAVQPGWKINFVDKSEDKDSSILAELYNRTVKTYKLAEICKLHAKKMKIFGVSYVLPCIDGIDYKAPYNADGINPNSFKGISVIEPYWITPMWSEGSLNNPATPDFYEPEYYKVRDLTIHKSHIIKVVNTEVPDILKPSYYFGGIPLTQMIYERVYAAEKVANEAPLMALTKRLNVIYTNLADILANPENAARNAQKLIKMRDNFGVLYQDSENRIEQHDTTLTDFDQLISKQYQLVAAVARMPAEKLFKSAIAGLNNSGDYTIKDYTQELQSLQERVYTPLINRINEIVLRSDFGNKDGVSINFNPIDTPTERETAEVQKMKAETHSAYINAGILSTEEVREELKADETSGYNNLSDEVPEDFNEEEYLNSVKGEENKPEVPTVEEKVKAVDSDPDWKEGEHPRNHGKFAKKGQGSSGAIKSDTKAENKEGNNENQRGIVKPKDDGKPVDADNPNDNEKLSDKENNSLKPVGKNDNNKSEGKPNERETNQRTDEFTELQNSCKKLLPEDIRLFHSGNRKPSKEIRELLSRVLRRELANSCSRNGYNQRLLNNKTLSKDVKFYENVSAEDFHDCFEIVQKYLPSGDVVDVHDIEDYKNTTNYLSEDGLSGISITSDGDLISVFNIGEAGFLKTIAPIVKKYVKTLDCFDSIKQPLPLYYKCAFGFKPAAAIKFNKQLLIDSKGKEYADYFVDTYGEAPIVFMVNTGKEVSVKEFKENEYKEAKAYQLSFVK